MNHSFMNGLGRLSSRNKTFQSQRAGLRLCLTMCVLLASPSTWAAVLDSIDFATQSGDRFEIMLGFDGAPPSPSLTPLNLPLEYRLIS